MKKFLFFAFFANSFLLSAQETLQINTTPPAGYVTREFAFAQLNTSQVTSGLLVDRSAPFLKIENYAGGGLADSNKIDPTKFGLAYARLSGAAISIGDTLLRPGNALGRLAKSADTIPIKVLLYDYHRLKPSALADGDVQVVNNQVFNVPGHNPFQSGTLFMVTPWAVPTLQGRVFVFRLQAPLTNRNADIQNILVDFADGQGYRNLTPGQAVRITYSESDTVTIRTKLRLTNGQVLESHSDLAVIVPEAEERDYAGPFNIPGITGAIVTGLSSCGDQTICKPLIIVEGFNAPAFGDAFDTDFQSFRFKIQNSNAVTPTPNSLLREFELAGYDIVYIDFTDGTASLESNAEVVKAVIRRVNELKAAAGCTQKNIVWGESMGGVLAKLALREMEVGGEDHECEKLFTFDSPLRGANIPLGYQFMLDHVANMGIRTEVFGSTTPLSEYVPMLAAAINTLEAPGPQQMLIYHKDHFPPSGGSPSEIFYDKLRNLGALASCEHIAISNGSQIMTGQGFANNATMLKVQGDISSILDECAGFSEFWGEVVEIFANLLFTQASFNFEVRALPAPTEGTKGIYFGAAFVEALTMNIADTYYSVAVGGTQPLDNTSGGYVEIDPELIACSIVDSDTCRFKSFHIQSVSYFVQHG